MHNERDIVSLYQLAKVLGCSTLLKNETFYLGLNIDLGALYELTFESVGKSTKVIKSKAKCLC